LIVERPAAPEAVVAHLHLALSQIADPVHPALCRRPDDLEPRESVVVS
jgi:hypothetical protein